MFCCAVTAHLGTRHHVEGLEPQAAPHAVDQHVDGCVEALLIGRRPEQTPLRREGRPLRRPCAPPGIGTLRPYLFIYLFIFYFLFIHHPLTGFTLLFLSVFLL